MQQLDEGLLGKLRVYAGFPKDKKAFLHEQFAENEDLATRIFSENSGRQLDLRANSIGLIKIPFAGAVLQLDGQDSNDNHIGFMLQWEDFRSFQLLSEAIDQVAIVEIR